MSESVEKFFESDLYVSEMLKVWEEGKEWGRVARLFGLRRPRQVGTSWTFPAVSGG